MHPHPDLRSWLLDRLPTAKLFLLLAGAVSPAGLVAAEPPAAEPETLPPMVVREALPRPEREQSNDEARQELERIPAGVGQVDDTRIERTRGASLQDALDFVPGVLVRSRGLSEEPQISIRGSGLRNNFHTRGVNVWLDDTPFQNADGFSDVESFEFLAAKRVEVTRARARCATAATRSAARSAS
jgi:iron complex outermembrane receptor protein